MALLGSSIAAIPAAITAGFMDVVSLFEFTIINYATGMIKTALAPQVPTGPFRNIVESGIDSAGEISKLLLFQSNTMAAPMNK
jgi:hypothetical protein